MPINFAVKLAATVAIEALQVGLQASKRTTGPRLDELKVTVADYGTPLPRFLGTRRFSCPVFHAEDLKETEKSTKVKGGGKQTAYHYYGTFACAIADCQIDEVLKIWFDSKLIYDATGATAVSYASSIGIDLNSVMRIYKGTEDQVADPRYVSWCEDRYGPDSAPAYRGLSYLFFEDLPLDNFGNRIPQVEVLATSATTSAYPYKLITVPGTVSNTGFYASGGNWIAHYFPGTASPIDWFDAPTASYVGTTTGADVMAGTVPNLDLGSDGTGYFMGLYQVGVSAFRGFYTVSPAGGYVRTSVDGIAGNVRVFDLSDGTRQVLGSGNPIAGGYSSYGIAINAGGDCAIDFCRYIGDEIVGLFEPLGSSSAFSILSLGGGSVALAVTALSSRSRPGSGAICYVESQDHFFTIVDSHWYTIDATTGAIKASGSWSGGYDNNLPRKTTASTSFWSGFSEISLVDGSTIRSVDPGLWSGAGTAAGEDLYDPINVALWSHITNTEVVRFLDRADGSGVTLGEIVAAMCDAAGLADRDTSLLTQIVQGYSWTRGDVKSQMEPVIDIHDVDARPHDFTIDFLPRGSAPSGTILTADLAKSSEGTARYKVTITQDTDLPKMLRVNFADTGFDQQANNVLSPLTLDSVDSQRDDVIDLTTYAAAPDEAQQLADRYMRRQWNSREHIDASVTAQKLALEPGDVTAFSLDGIVHNVRLTKQTITVGQIDCTFIRDETSFAALNSATTGPAMDGRDTETITIPAPVKGFVIDAPLRQDSDADVRPLLYSGAGAYASLSFPGAVIYEATGSGSSLAYDTLFASLTSGVTWGLCNSTLATVPSPWLWDRKNTLTVSLQKGSLTSVAESDIDADRSLNLILVGSSGNWEYLNFTTATLNANGTYTLSGFKRGRRGTEWACPNHSAGEAWVLASALAVEEMGADDIGADLSFKAQALGRSLDSASAIDIDPFSAASLKPYAPANIKWSYDGTDLTGTITRRTRIGGAWSGGSSIPLSENSEAYEVDVYNGSTLKRTISVSGTNVFTYTAAMASADGITLPTSPTVNVYQMSDEVGRGYALAA